MNLLKCLRSMRSFTTSTNLRSIAVNSCQAHQTENKHKFHLSKPVFDEKFLLDKNNITKIDENNKLRKGVGDIYLVHEINKKLKDSSTNDEARHELEVKLQEELKKIPNQTHPDVRKYEDEPKVVNYYNDEPSFKQAPLEFSEICKKLNILRTEHLGNFAGHKSYYLMADLAEMVTNHPYKFIEIIKSFNFLGACINSIHNGRNTSTWI